MGQKHCSYKHPFDHFSRNIRYRRVQCTSNYNSRSGARRYECRGQHFHSSATAMTKLLPRFYRNFGSLTCDKRTPLPLHNLRSVTPLYVVQILFCDEYILVSAIRPKKEAFCPVQDTTLFPIIPCPVASQPFTRDAPPSPRDLPPLTVSDGHRYLILSRFWRNNDSPSPSKPLIVLPSISRQYR